MKSHPYESLRSKITAVKKSVTWWAGWLDRRGRIYEAYAVVDGLAIVQSSNKVLFDFLDPNSSFYNADHMHEWMITPEGLIITALESIGLIIFSYAGNVFKDNDKNVLKRHLAMLWPYFRDALKAVKNTYKGIRSLLQSVMVVIGANELRMFIIPFGMVFGALAVSNRICIRKYVVEPRKKKVKANKDLLQEIKKWHFESLSNKEFQDQFNLYYSRIERHSHRLNVAAMFAAAYTGVVDGLYLYMGAMSLLTLPPPLFLAMLLVSSTFSLLCIGMRVYEEYEYQRDLHRRGLEVEVLLDAFALKRLFKCWKESKTLELKNEINGKLTALEIKLNQQRDFQVFSYQRSFWAGIRYALAAYSAIVATMFFVAVMTALAGSHFPPLVMVFGMLAGISLLIGFVGYALYKHYRFVKTEKSQSEAPVFSTNALCECLEQHKDLDPNLLYIGVMEEPPSSIPAACEVARSLSSGGYKGPKTIDFLLSYWQQLDAKGHYKSLPFTMALAGAGAVIHATILALRALARWLGKKEKANKENSAGQAFEQLPPDSPPDMAVTFDLPSLPSTPPPTPSPSSPLTQNSFFVAPPVDTPPSPGKCTPTNRFFVSSAMSPGPDCIALGLR